MATSFLSIVELSKRREKKKKEQTCASDVRERGITSSISRRGEKKRGDPPNRRRLYPLRGKGKGEREGAAFMSQTAPFDQKILEKKITLLHSLHLLPEERGGGEKK